ITVAQLPNADEALVFLGGNPYLSAAPDTVAGQFPGLAGGGLGPDIRFGGLDSSITLNGNGNTGTAGQGDRAIVYAASEMDLLTAGGGADPDYFGFGAGVLTPGFGGGNAFDIITVDGTGVSTVNNANGALVRVNVDVSFAQAGPPAPAQRAALIVNGGDEAIPQPNGIADQFFATPSAEFNIQVNGNLPALGPIGPDGFPAGDELVLNSPESINVFSDKAAVPNVSTTFGNNIFGVVSSSIERLRMSAANGVVNLIGDNNDPNVDQNDNFVVRGRDVNGSGEGRNELTLQINGSAPILVDGVTDMNVYGFDLAGEPDLNNPDPNRVDPSGAVANNIDTLDISAYADDTPQGWGVDVFFSEGGPAGQDGGQADLIIYNTS
ncbi:MAG: hypothetical protein KDA41_17205, partial [Planctomycetales bacterium]|nr:hypothetical protein [Planctomycetales bacterium]